MSIQFDKEIFSNSNIILKVNFSGFKNDTVNSSDFKMTLYAYDKNGNPKFAETLDFFQVKSLYEHLNQISIIKDSTKTTSGKFIETSDSVLEIIDGLKNIDLKLLKTVLDKFTEKDKVEKLFEILSEVELEYLTTAHKHQVYQTELENLNKLLELEDSGNIVEAIKAYDALKPYCAGQPEKIFQNWIEKNYSWIFGVEYLKKYDARKIALFSEGDLLMESLDGFLDLIELKRPKLEYDIFKYDTSHKSYYPSNDLSKVLGQCLFYLQKLDDFKLILEKEHKVKILRPRIKIIAGRTVNFNDEQFNALRMLNSNLNNIEIISYDYLLNCGTKMISNLL